MSTRRFAGGRMIDSARSGSPGPQDFLDFLDIDTMLGNVLNIALRVVVQIPDDLRVDHRCLP